ncbi:MAG: Crp/Fnr family transcriptional regulator [Coriobacteriia bacterium]|nr:Crp/Fnr family transcriptional regulator [Coriobacteriia bacterium]
MTLDESDSTRRFYEDGDLVFAEGSPGEHLYVVVEGGVAIRRRGELFTSVIAEFGPGEIFGELALFEHKPHSAEATAIGETMLALYDRATFIAALEGDPELALRVIESLSSRLRDTTDKLQQIATQHILDRTEMALVQRAVLESDLSS